MARRSSRLALSLWQTVFIQSYVKRAQQSEQYTDNCAELANLLSQFDNFGLQFAMIQIEGFGGHDRTAAVRPPSVRGRSGDTIWNNELRITRRIDDVSKAMIVGLDGSFLREPHARILAGRSLDTTGLFHTGWLVVVLSDQLSSARTEKCYMSWRVAPKASIDRLLCRICSIHVVPGEQVSPLAC